MCQYQHSHTTRLLSARRLRRENLHLHLHHVITEVSLPPSCCALSGTPLKVRIHTRTHARTHAHTHTHPFNGPFSGTTRVSRYQRGKTNLDFTEARDSEWQWHQLGHMQVCISLQTDNHASTPPLKVFYRPGAFLLPNQQRQSTEGLSTQGPYTLYKITTSCTNRCTTGYKVYLRIDEWFFTVSCLFARISLKPVSRTSPNYIWMSAVVVVRSSSGGVAIRCVLPYFRFCG